ncbi:3-deoxy-manno-octulosonate cytidylyltransferase [Aliiglaciecola sp. 2_MG-2023]|uniref:3-deoxy-manno-octulosonate cytidylyltransferase n=1 Tax=unclassified Aliiglaciecola TaxID=2593648 RepID=UPI0026E24602|nr:MULTISPECIES: 3-deoxy-manno-octulosonate cytidylyltransferase [unclassified Aliiglaciecola]MDO6711795.1 3-deoxy-manno-octulosonate cytidylyltransferase [Aliiglaciecola sp. 2_MG-2023]MDO6753031.1 3-deoxy-manno-octulosonate cytidylyltransferase [Aliiglaciecola sp. 1_MG-2023]
MKFTVIIPARYASTRFPGKPLVEIGGKPMVQHVYERALEAGATRVIVATDDARIAKTVTDFGGNYCMTAAHHESGTERLAEVVDVEGLLAHELVVNVQGDEPFIPAENIRQVAENLFQYKDAEMATLGVKITDVEDAFNPNVVKVVTDKIGYALYFSRSAIPYDRSRFMDADSIDEIGDFYLRHIGIYAYRAGFIKQYVNMAPSGLEQIESLEQLRVLWHGERIHVDEAQKAPPTGIDTPEDLEKLIQTLQNGE